MRHSLLKEEEQRMIYPLSHYTNLWDASKCHQGLSSIYDQAMITVRILIAITQLVNYYGS